MGSLVRVFLAAGVMLGLVGATARARADEPTRGSEEPTSTDAERAQARENRLRMIEARLAADEKAKPDADKLTWLKRLKITGYVQPQFVVQRFNGTASPNLIDGRLPPEVGPNSVVAKSDGTTTNSNMFRIRRARLKIEYAPTDYARFKAELDPFPVGGSTAGVGMYARTLEAIGTAKWTDDGETDFGMGLFKVPFGYEIWAENSAQRLFIERSAGADNMFPGLRDIGFRATTTGYDKKFQVTLAVINGYLQGEKGFVSLPDFNRGKDFAGRMTYDFGRFQLGVSGYWGKGALVDGTLLRFKQYNRYGFDFELVASREVFKELGKTFVHMEMMVGQNMDRGTKYPFALPAIPVNVNDKVADKDQFSFQVRLEQDVTRWVTIGLRYDRYSPDTAQATNVRDGWSAVGAINFTKGLSLRNEFDYAFDSVRAPGKPDPAREIATISSVLQAQF